MTKKLIPRLKKGRKLLKGRDGTPVQIYKGKYYSMTPDGRFVLRDPNGELRYFDDMATRDSLSWEWYPYEDEAPESAYKIIKGHLVPNREDPYYKKALELAEKQKKAKRSEKKERGGIIKGQDGPNSDKLTLKAEETRNAISKRRAKLHLKELLTKWDKEYADAKLLQSSSPYEYIILFPSGALDPAYESIYRNGTPSEKVSYIIRSNAPYTINPDGSYDFTRNPGLTYRVIYSDGRVADYNGTYANENVQNIWNYLFHKLGGSYFGGTLPNTDIVEINPRQEEGMPISMTYDFTGNYGTPYRYRGRSLNENGNNEWLDSMKVVGTVPDYGNNDTIIFGTYRPKRTFTPISVLYTPREEDLFRPRVDFLKSKIREAEESGYPIPVK